MMIPTIDPALEPLEAVNPAVFIRMAFEGVPLAPLIQARVDALGASDGDAARLLELGLLFQLVGEPDRAMTCQKAALDIHRLYRHRPPEGVRLRLLMLATQGDLMTNTPLELMLEGRGVEITKLYLQAGDPPPSAVPEHDLAIMAVSESDAARPLLEDLIGIEDRWPRPMINGASGVLALARDSLYLRLQSAPGLHIPPTVLAPREALAAASDQPDFGGLLPGGRFPLIIRPVGSHAGRGLERIDDAGALVAYLAEAGSAVFYISPFVDYAGADGLFRKLRIVFFAGRPYLCHMAVSERWMVHYLNADMAENPARRAEEQTAMETFDSGFARRHADAFASLQDRLGLDLFAIDCAELPDGRLLIFEADVAMVIHDLDPEELYPYKKPQMRKVFDAFERFLHAAGGEPSHSAPVNPSSAA